MWARRRAPLANASARDTPNFFAETLSRFSPCEAGRLLATVDSRSAQKFKSSTVGLIATLIKFLFIAGRGFACRQRLECSAV